MGWLARTLPAGEHPARAEGHSGAIRRLYNPVKLFPTAFTPVRGESCALGRRRTIPARLAVLVA